MTARLEHIARLLLFAACLPPCLAQQSFPLDRIHVRGLERLDAEAVARATGLVVGQPVSEADFERASMRLVDTGFFLAVRYSFGPSSAKGFEVTFQVDEDPNLTPVVLSIPEVDAAELWAWLGRHDPLITGLIPGTDAASDRYARAIEAYLSERGRPDRIIATVEEDPDTRAARIFFRPENLPLVREVIFRGNQAIDAETLFAAAAKALDRLEYTPHRVLEAIALNVAPLYREQGYLRVEFPRVSEAGRTADGGLRVAVDVVEGPQYRLRRVSLEGEGSEPGTLLSRAGFPHDDTANWRTIEQAIETIREEFRSQGYLAVKVIAEPGFETLPPVVDLDLRLERGPLYVFGELLLDNLDRAHEQEARRRWKLEPGAPFRQAYLTGYLKELFALPAFHLNFGSVARSLEIREGSTAVNVRIRFLARKGL
jgi:outer membrane protein assembly factor BamA